MKGSIFITLIVLMLLTACGPNQNGNVSVDNQPAAEQVVVIVTKIPTATNFPRAGTPTPVPPTITPAPTPTSLPKEPLFNDDTLSEMMKGTIETAGLEANVAITDDRANGGKRVANITLVSEHNIEENDLLLKLFVLEVGAALRAMRAFSDGSIDADLDSAFVVVNNQEGQLLGTVTADLPAIEAFMQGNLSVNEILDRLELTGVFQTFRQQQ